MTDWRSLDLTLNRQVTVLDTAVKVLFYHHASIGNASKIEPIVSMALISNLSQRVIDFMRLR
ncbi:MAG TPA: hypothetical protein DCL66_06360 [Gammaproteobacteria bacterium]|nr:hypothetical protein [Gammaproteobacteria bacterium]